MYDKLHAGEEEVWVPVVGFEDFYDVSNFGKVRSKHKGPYFGKILRPATNEGGYLKLVLSNGKPLQKYVHRVVKSSFYANPDPGYLKTVEHHDCVRDNCRLDNLIFANTLYQNQPSNLKANPTTNSAKRYRKVDMHDLDGKFLMTHESCKAAQEWLRQTGDQVQINM